MSEVVTFIPSLPAVEPWPTRKSPQDRFDVAVQTAMNQMSTMVDSLNNEWIPAVNALGKKIQTDADIAETSAADAKASERAAKASERAAKASEDSAATSATTASQNARSAITSASNAAISANNAANSASRAALSATSADLSAQSAAAHESEAKIAANSVKEASISAGEDADRAEAAAEYVTTFYDGLDARLTEAQEKITRLTEELDALRLHTNQQLAYGALASLLQSQRISDVQREAASQLAVVDEALKDAITLLRLHVSEQLARGSVTNILQSKRIGILMEAITLASFVADSGETLDAEDIDFVSDDGTLVVPADELTLTTQ